MNAEIKWCEPPALKRASRAGKGRWYRALDTLRQHPGVWANIGAADRSVGSLISAGRLGGAHPGEFEVTTRIRDDGKCDIYARFVGDA